MSTATSLLSSYPSYVDREIRFPGVISKGARGHKARQVQEWVSFNGFRTAIDSDYGPATARSVKEFQASKGLTVNGKIGRDTWTHLIAPMVHVLTLPQPKATFGATVLALAKQHLKVHPVEIGGQNQGPWVRLYMNGHQGPAWPWCAGFVTFLLKQATKVHDTSMPISGSFSCDVLAAQAKAKNRFISERDIKKGNTSFNSSGMGECSIFLVRRTSTDWTHTGLAHNYDSNGTLMTIEGNTNDDGVREGYEVCTRSRSRSSKDFINIS